MVTETPTSYPVLLASLIFISILLAMFMYSLLRQYRIRLLEYEWQLEREIALIDAERNRMHIDLHDEIGAGLASIGILLQQDLINDKRIHRKMLEQVTCMRSKIREIAYNFVPHSLEKIGLKKSLIEFFEDIHTSHTVIVKSLLEFEDTKFIPQKAIHVYRIIKEIITNALKHANCQKITCSLIAKQNKLLLIITDNGIGFDSNSKVYKNKGAGLSHINSRAKLLHATIDLVTFPEAGVKYEISIPLDSMLNNFENG